jgi:alkylation response protein AidB-like acyl-CoA dehydrogenase
VNFEFSPEELEFQEEVRAFLEQVQSEEVMDSSPEQLSQTVDTPAKRAFMGQLAERGWLGMSWPEQYGGQARSGVYDFLLTEQLSRFGAPQPGKGVGMVGKTLIRHGSDTLKQYFLPRIIRGEVEFAVGYSEPEAGSDAAAMALKATRDPEGAGWRLNGRKTWTTSAHFADWYWLGARTDPDASKHKGITLFLLKMDTPGMTIHPTWTIGDERTNEVFFDDVFVGDEYVVGDLNHGWTYICEALDLERFTMMPIGPLERKVEALNDYVRSAKRDGEPISRDPVVRQQLAHVLTELEVARMLQRQVIAAALRGGVPTVESSMYKLYMTRLGQQVSDIGLSIMGHEGQLARGEDAAPLDGRFERSYRYTVVDTIGGGTSEIQKNIIARRALGLPANY